MPQQLQLGYSGGPGATTYADWPADRIRVTKVVPAIDCTIESVWVYVAGVGSGTGNQVLKPVVYSDSSGTPSTLLETGSAVTITDGAGAAYVELPLTSGESLTAGTTYWIGAHAGDATNTIRVYAATSNGDYWYADDEYDNGAPSSWPAGGTSAAYQYLFYGGCTTSGGNLGFINTNGASDNSGTGARTDVAKASPITTDDESVAVDSLWFWIGNGPGSGTQKHKAVVYADSSGQPGALIGTSTEVTIPDAPSWSWVEFEFSTPPVLEANTKYWFGLHSGDTDTASAYKYQTSPRTSTYYYYSDSDEYDDGPPDPFVGSSTNNTCLLFYADLTPRIAFRTDSIADSSTTSVTITKPANTVDGDILLACVAAYALGAAPTISAPDGTWTKLDEQGWGGNSNAAIFWKRASSEGSSYQFTCSGGTSGWKMYGYMMSISGSTGGGSPVEAISTSFYTTYDSTLRGKSITVNKQPFLLVWIGGLTAQTEDAITPPSGFTERNDSYTANHHIGVATYNSISTGSTGDKDGTAYKTGSPYSVGSKTHWLVAVSEVASTPVTIELTDAMKTSSVLLPAPTVTATWHKIVAVEGACLATALFDSGVNIWPLLAQAMEVSAIAIPCSPYFITEGIEISRKQGDEGTYDIITVRKELTDYWDDPGPFDKSSWYYYRSRRYIDDEFSNYSPEYSIQYIGSVDVDLDVISALYTASFLAPEVFVDKDVFPDSMNASSVAYPARLIYSSIFGVETMEVSAAETTFYYAWGTGPSHTDHVPNPFSAVQAGVLAPVVIIPKTISTTVVLAGAAHAGGAGLIMNTKKFPDRMPADALLAGGDDAHDIDGFIVTVRKTSSSSAYTMGTTPAEETVHYVSPDKREFKLYGVPADERYTMGVRAYRIVDPDIDVDGVLQSSVAQYPAVGQPPISSQNVVYDGYISSTDYTAADVATGATQGADAYTVTSTAFDSGKLIASWQPDSATAVPYSFSGLFGNNSYLGYVTRGADPASPVWKTFMDSTGNFYLGGSNGSSSGLAWASSSNDLSINFDNTTSGGITMSTKGYIKAGQTAYNTGTGFFLGYSTDAVKLSIGTSTQGITWDGTTLTVKGTVEVTNPEDFGNKNWTTQPQTSDAYNVGDLWLDTTATPPKIWKCITSKSAGAAFDYAHWTISTTRVYNAQPTTPYALGDMWLDGTTSPPNTWQCTTARASGSFVAGDWTKIGDSTVATIQAGTTITGGYIQMSAGGKIYSAGKTTYNSSTAGFFLGYTGSVYAFGVGNASRYLTWDGSNLSFSGTLVGTDGTFSGTLSASCLVGGTLSLGNSVTISSSGFISPYLTANASGATFSGNLSAAGGTFSGTISASQVTSGTMSAARISGGTLTGVTINALTSCTIGTTLYVNGEIFLTNGSPGTYRDIHFDNTNTNKITYSSVGVAVQGSDGASLNSGTSEVRAASGEGVCLTPYICMGSAGGPQIRYGAAPTEGSITTYPLGTILMSTGGSLWMVYLDGANYKWTKIWTHISHA